MPGRNGRPPLIFNVSDLQPGPKLIAVARRPKTGGADHQLRAQRMSSLKAMADQCGMNTAVAEPRDHAAGAETADAIAKAERADACGFAAATGEDAVELLDALTV